MAIPSEAWNLLSGYSALPARTRFFLALFLFLFALSTAVPVWDHGHDILYSQGYFRPTMRLPIHSSDHLEEGPVHT
jgi:hypothetical protein